MYVTFYKDFVSRGVPMDLELFLKVLKSPETKKKVTAYQTETDARRKQEIKKTLPQALFQSYSTNGVRSKSTTKSNGLVLVDIDHISNPREQFKEKVLPLKELISLRLAYVTVSGEGLRLVCDLQPHLSTIKENQQEICKVLGFSFDEACCDFSRTSFLTTYDDLLYLDEKMFTDEPLTTLVNPDYKDEEKLAEAVEEASEAESLSVSEDISQREMPQGQKATELTYRGIPYANIMADYWVDRGGVPRHGERHSEVLKFMHRLKHICGFDAQKMEDVLGDAFGLEKDELRRMIKDVLAYPCSGKMPYDLYQILQRYGVVDDVDEVDANEEKAFPVMDSDIPVNDLPRIIKMWVDIAPEGFKTPMFFVVVTILGFLYTRLRAYYADGLKHSTTLMMTLEAPMTSGKGFAKRVVDILTKRVKEDDALARADEKAYKLALSKSKNRKDQPEEPTSFIRVIPGRNSLSKLLIRISKSMGLHLFSYDSEISSVLNNQGASWADKSSLYRNSFDNDNFSQDYMSDNAASEDVPVFLNFVFAGTPREVGKLYADVEDGTSTRIIPCSLPDQFGQKFPVWGQLSKKDYLAIEQMQEEAQEMTYTEDRQIKDEVILDMRWLFPVISDWLEEQRMYSVKSGITPICLLRKRAANIAFRIAMIVYQLFGCKPSSRKKVASVFRWTATAVIHMQYNRFGEEISLLDEEEKKKKMKSKSLKMTKSETLFDLLPKDFGVQDIEKAKLKVGIKREARKVVSDLVLTGLVEKVAAGKWVKK